MQQEMADVYVRSESSHWGPSVYRASQVDILLFTLGGRNLTSVFSEDTKEAQKSPDHTAGISGGTAGT